jgi:uncharacterized phage-associated protein
MAAFFAKKDGDVIPVLKLTKLLYLADREALARYGEPITYDIPVSMDQGPVLSRALDLVNGDVNGAPAAQWDEWMTPRQGYDVAVKRQFSRDDLDELSDADLEVLEIVWHKFGHMDKWTLRDWTHQNCQEWTDPEGSSLPIDEADRLRAVGIPADQAKMLAEEIRAQRDLDRRFAQAARV